MRDYFHKYCYDETDTTNPDSYREDAQSNDCFSRQRFPVCPASPAGGRQAGM